MTDPQVRKWADRMTFAFMAPIITWPRMEDTVTQEQREKAKMARMVKLMVKDESEEATDFEACIYLMTYTLECPPAREVYNVYAHVFKSCFPEQAKTVFDKYELENPLDIQESQLLSGLKRWIYKKQTEHLREKEATEKVVSQVGLEGFFK